MRRTISKLKKLRGRSIDEIADRSRQQAFTLRERFFGFGTSEMKDDELFSEFHPRFKNGSDEGSAMLILDRIRRCLGATDRASTPLPFRAVLSSHEQLCSIMKSRFHSE